MKTCTAVETAQILVDRIILRFGTPKRIQSDRGSNFVSEVFQKVVSLLGSRQIFSAAYHSQSIGLLERSHKGINSVLAKHMSPEQRNWDDYIQLACFVHNSRFSEALGHYTPNELLYGRELMMPIMRNITRAEVGTLSYDEHVSNLLQKLGVIRETAKCAQRIYSQNMKSRYDKRVRGLEYHVGDKVVLHKPQGKRGLSRKLQPSYDGIYVVLERIEQSNNYILQEFDGEGKILPNAINGDRLRLVGKRKEIEVTPDDSGPEDIMSDQLILDQTDDAISDLGISSGGATAIRDLQWKLPSEQLNRNQGVRSIKKGRKLPSGKIEYCIVYKDFAPTDEGIWVSQEKLTNEELKMIEEIQPRIFRHIPKRDDEMYDYEI